MTSNIRLPLTAGALLMLAGCGGSGGGGMGSTPPPPPTPVNTSLTNLQYSQDFVGNAAVVRFTLSAITGSATSRGGASTGAAQVRYDANSKSYTLVGTALAQSTFGTGNRVANQTSATITTYEKTGNRQENLVLFNTGAGNPQLALTYASFGAYQSIATGSSSVDVDTAFFTYGVPTAAADVPRTGSATYQTQMEGQFADASGAYALAGASSFAADFGNATVSLSMTPVGANVVTGDIKSFGQQRVNGTIASGSNRFEGNGEGGGYTAAMSGQFYGPGAAEMGATFSLTGNGGAGVGAVVGKKN